LLFVSTVSSLGFRGLIRLPPFPRKAMGTRLPFFLQCKTVNFPACPHALRTPLISYRPILQSLPFLFLRRWRLRGECGLLQDDSSLALFCRYQSPIPSLARRLSEPPSPCRAVPGPTTSHRKNSSVLSLYFFFHSDLPAFYFHLRGGFHDGRTEECSDRSLFRDLSVSSHQIPFARDPNFFPPPPLVFLVTVLNHTPLFRNSLLSASAEFMRNSALSLIESYDLLMQDESYTEFQ